MSSSYRDCQEKYQCASAFAGYFKKKLSPDEKQELIGYRNLSQATGTSDRTNNPLQSLYKKIRDPISEAALLNPHPLELMLRNHA